MSPFRAILLQSPGHKPWVSYYNTFIEPPRGGTTLRQIRALKVPLLKELNLLLSEYPQGFILSFALIPPWALQECRAYGTRILHFKLSKFETYFNIQK